MKLFKKLLVTCSAALLCLAPIFGPAIDAQAESPVTYYVSYEEDMGDWRFQTGTWDNNSPHRDLYYMSLDIKDGDHLVIDGHSSIKLNVNVKLESLTILHADGAIITTKGINNLYALNESVSAVNGDVNYAAVYDDASLNINNNVDTLELLSNRYENLNQTVAALGTVNHLKASGKSYVHFELYNFTKGSLLIDEGSLKTKSSNYSEVPAAATAAPSAPSSSADAYDEVPKTGDIRFNPLWLVAIAAVCLIGSYELKKKY